MLIEMPNHMMMLPSHRLTGTPNKNDAAYYQLTAKRQG